MRNRASPLRRWPLRWRCRCQARHVISECSAITNWCRLHPGGYVQYALAQARSTRHRFLLDMQAYLPTLLGVEQAGRVRPSVAAEAGEATRTAVNNALIKCFTAYTHLRRLLLLRYLARRGACTAEQLCAQLNMSAAAVQRHLRKLQRRSLLVSGHVPGVWMLAAQPPGSGQRSLLAIVVRALEAQGR